MGREAGTQNPKEPVSLPLPLSEPDPESESESESESEESEGKPVSRSNNVMSLILAS